MHKLSTLLFAVVVGLTAPDQAARAQARDSTVRARDGAVDPRDSVFLRARQLVLEGNGSAGRALLDSAVAASAGTPDYATALYWRGALSSTAADAERDYRRVIVDYPFSPHAGDALLALAQLEMARGDRESAIDHLQRFLLQRPNDPERVRAGIWLGRMLLETNQPARGCAVLLRTRAALGDTAIEVRNQVDYYAARCAGVDTIPPAPHVATSQPAKPQGPADTVSRRRSSSRDSTRADTVRRLRAPDTTTKSTSRRTKAKAEDSTVAAKRFTVQVAAYDTRSAAEQLVSRLSARGVVARVVDVGRPPYRVRIGHYATDAEATTAARELKGKGITGFVTTTDNEAARAPSRP